MNHYLASPIAAVLVSTSACTGSLPPVIMPVPDSARTEPSPVSKHLSVLPGIFRYQLTQITEIRAAGDTVPGSTTTHAVIAVNVAARADSGLDVVISIDSITIEVHGSIPTSRAPQLTKLDSVIRALLTPTKVTISSSLPDSLCVYSGLTALASELLLPELPGQIETPLRRLYGDTSTTMSCRAGVSLQSQVTRQIQDLGQDPPQFAIHQNVELTGGGIVRRDSLLITGSISTHGTASFRNSHRLPTTTHSISEGTITIRLGSTTTIFQQSSRQTLQELSQIPLRD